MILTIALTQFVFLSLGILTVNVLLKAGGYAQNIASSFPEFSVWMATQSLWLFALPLAWVALTALCLHFAKGRGGEITAKITGVALILAIFAAYFYAAFLLF
ncbi:MAG: hypothetical protein ACOVLK_06855 [Terrimicrobiaceae bacterium]|jgi:hypothetical protein